MGIHQHGQFRLPQHIDEPGGHHHSMGVDGALGRGAREVADSCNLPPANGHIRAVPRRPGAVDDVPVADHEIVRADGSGEQQYGKQKWHTCQYTPPRTVCFSLPEQSEQIGR